LEAEMDHTFRPDFTLKSVQDAIAAGEDWGKASEWVM